MGVQQILKAKLQLIKSSFVVKALILKFVSFKEALFVLSFNMVNFLPCNFVEFFLDGTILPFRGLILGRIVPAEGSTECISALFIEIDNWIEGKDEVLL